MTTKAIEFVNNEFYTYSAEDRSSIALYLLGYMANNMPDDAIDSVHKYIRTEGIKSNGQAK